MDIHNYEKRYKRRLELIRESDIPNADKEIIFKFNNYCLTRDIGCAKLEVYLFYLLRFVKMLKKPIVEATKDDLMRVVAELNQSHYSEETKKAFKTSLKRLYKIVRGVDDDGVFPEEVRWIDVKIKNNHRKLPEELINEEEINSIVHCAEKFRDKALIATLYESGCRVSEVGLMKIKHVSFEEHGARLTVSGKTGTRKILVINSSPFLKQWINQHPYNRDPDSYLWYNPQNNGCLNYTRIVAILKMAAKKAGVNKKLHPHLLRHSRATKLANVMSDSQLKNYLGWTQSSRMASIYIHMSGKDTDDAILKTNGIEIKQETPKEPALKPLECLNCQTINVATNRCCNTCGMILDKKMQNKILGEDQRKIEANNFMNELFNDPEILRLVMKKVKEVKIANERNV